MVRNVHLITGRDFFEESVWEYVESIDKYYFHIFSKEMPDLNWENPKT